MRPHTARVFVLAMAFVANAQLAAQASVRVFGKPCVFENQKPELLVAGLPQLGGSVTLSYLGPNFSTSPSQRVAWPQLVLGMAPKKTDLLPSLLPQQPVGCMGFVLPEIIAPMAVAASNPLKFETQVTLPVPNERALVGLHVFAQWLTVVQQCGVAGCSAVALLTSNAAEFTIG